MKTVYIEIPQLIPVRMPIVDVHIDTSVPDYVQDELLGQNWRALEATQGVNFIYQLPFQLMSKQQHLNATEKEMYRIREEEFVKAIKMTLDNDGIR